MGTPVIKTSSYTGNINTHYVDLIHIDRSRRDRIYLCIRLHLLQKLRRLTNDVSTL